MQSKQYQKPEARKRKYDLKVKKTDEEVTLINKNNKCAASQASVSFTRSRKAFTNGQLCTFSTSFRRSETSLRSDSLSSLRLPTALRNSATSALLTDP